MYIIQIHLEAHTPMFPHEFKTSELAEFTVEGAVACSLENLFTSIAIKGITVSRSSQTEIKKEANAPMYVIKIHVEADAAVFPYELKNTELAEVVVEGAVACSLENLFIVVEMKEVTISRSTRDAEPDWDVLLP